MENKLYSKIYPMRLLFPALAFYGVFYLFSTLLGFYLSTTDWNITRLNNIEFIGIENFIRLFKEDYFTLAIKNVAIFTIISAIFRNILGLLLAIMLDQKMKGIKIFRTIFFLPCVLSTLVVGYVFTFIFNPTIGLLNTYLTEYGLQALALDWLGNSKIALFSIISVDIWMWTGFNTIIYLAGLQTVPSELYEASSIDGAGRWKTFKNITIPLIGASITVNLILNIIGGLKTFDLIFVMTSGGPGFATEVLNTLMFKAMSTGTLGYATAIGVVQFIFVAVITFPVLGILRKREVEL